MRKSLALYTCFAILGAPIMFGQPANAQTTGAGSVAPATGATASPNASPVISPAAPGNNPNVPADINNSRDDTPVGATTNRDYRTTAGQPGIHKQNKHWNSQTQTNPSGGAEPQNTSTGSSMNDGNSSTGTGSGADMGHGH